MTDVRLVEFSQLLAAADEGGRNALLARAKLMAMNAAAPEAFEAPIITLGEYLASDIPVPPILVEPGLVVRGGISCLIGRSGRGKTQYSLNRSLRWSCGQPMFDGIKTNDDRVVLGPSHPLRILVIENEGAPGLFHQQMTTMVNAEGYLTDSDRHMVKENVLIWGDGGYSGLKLDDGGHLNNVRSGCEKWEPDIVFIEPFRGLWTGDENSATEMSKIADALSGIAADYNCGVVLTHHERKSGTGEDGEKMSAGRGSTVLEGVVATMENFDAAVGGDYRDWSVSKLRYGGGVPVLPVRMEWQSQAFWYKHIPMEESEQAILDAMAEQPDDPITVKELSKETSETESRVRAIIKDLEKAGKVKKMPSMGNGSRYRLTVSLGSNDDEMEF